MFLLCFALVSVAFPIVMKAIAGTLDLNVSAEGGGSGTEGSGEEAGNGHDGVRSGGADRTFGTSMGNSNKQQRASLTMGGTGVVVERMSNASSRCMKQNSFP